MSGTLLLRPSRALPADLLLSTRDDVHHLVNVVAVAPPLDVMLKKDGLRERKLFPFSFVTT